MEPHSDRFENSRNDRTIWAAYVLGHHVLDLDTKVRAMWSCRDSIYEGRQPVPQFPSEADELIAAIRLLVEAHCCDATSAMRLTHSATEWKHALQDMLMHFDSEFLGPWKLDWESAAPPGWQGCHELSQVAKVVLKWDSLLEDWRALGDQIAKIEAGDVPDYVSAWELLAPKLHDLNWNGDFKFIDEIAGKVGSEGSRVSMRTIEQWLRRFLSAEVYPEVWLRMDGEVIVFLGMGNLKLTQAELGILWLLAESARRYVKPKTIISRLGLGCRPENFPPHVSRLRKKLQPAIDAKFADLKHRPESAAKAFIPEEDATEGYILDIPSVRVRLDGRPAHVKP